MQIDVVRQKYQTAIDGLSKNIWAVHGYAPPVLVEGSVYPGIWLECGPLEGLIYGQRCTDRAHEVARANHDVFFARQRADGYFPCYIWKETTGYSQIQMVVPIAATALETADLLGDEAFLARAYAACSRWDNWLSTHRNTRGTGLCEAFCEADTGHDNSPRFKGLPFLCPNDDAAICPDAGGLPYLAPDLSASVYGGRVALAKMADRLNKPAEARQWQDKADHIRQAIIKHCFDPEDECFYDVDRDGRFNKLRADAITRVLGEHVVDQPTFDRIYARYIRNEQEFWTPYPLPSVSISDPKFIKELPRNSWGGAAQALTALRAPRWFIHYGRSDDLRHLMTQWVNACCASDMFAQQINPWTGEFIGKDGYSPAMLVFVDFVQRLGLLDPAPA